MQNLNPIVTAAMANKTDTTKLGPMKNTPTVRASRLVFAPSQLIRHRCRRAVKKGMGCSHPGLR
jgi:hypothetical protein